MKQLYRIVSDISTQYEVKETSFCVKVINGICQTYTGVFKEWQPSTALCEINAQYIGLCLIEDHLEPGDMVIIHSDTLPSKRTIKSLLPYSSLLTKLRQKGILINFAGVNTNRSNKYVHNVLLHYQCCHKLAGTKLKARWRLHKSFNKNYEFMNSYIWGTVKPTEL